MKSMKSLDVLVDSVIKSTGIDAEENDYRKSYLNFSSEDIKQLTNLHEPLKNAQVQLMDAFYAHLQNFSETREFLHDPEVVSVLA